MKVTEQNETETDFHSLLLGFEDLKKEFEVLGNAYTMQENALKNLQTEYETQAGLIQRLRNDLGLGVHHSYRNKTTRQLAQEAFNQSTVKANWEGLGKHPVIESIYKDIEIRSTDEGRRADDIIRKFEYMPDFHEIMKQVGDHSEIGNLWSRVESIDSGIAELKDVQKVDRHNIYAKLATQRDKMADIETAINMIDFVMGDTFDSHNSAFIFLMGAFAELGKGRVEEGLRFMLKKPKEPKDHETTDETSQES